MLKRFRNGQKFFLGDPRAPEASIQYIQDRFKRLVSAEIQQEKQLYVHTTNATDTRNIDRVFESCLDVVFKLNMERVGFM